MASISNALVIRHGDGEWFFEPEVVDGASFVQISGQCWGLSKLVWVNPRGLHRAAWFDNLKCRRMDALLDVVSPPSQSRFDASRE